MRLKFLLAILIAMLAGYLAVHNVDWPAFTEAFKKLDLKIWLLALPLYLVAHLVRALRWKIILGPSISVRFSRLFPYIMIGRAVNDMIPTGAGEFYRSYLIYKRDGLPYTNSLASILVERVFDGLVLVGILAAVFWIVGIEHEMALGIRTIALVFFSCIVVVVLVFVRFPLVFKKIVNPLISKLPEKISSLIDKGFDDFIGGLQVFKYPYVMLLTTMLTFLVWASEIFFYYTLMVAFNIQPEIWWAALTIAIASLMVVVPSAPGYVGLYHWAVVLSLGICGIAESRALAVAVILNITDLGITFFLGFGFMLKMGLGFSSPKKLEQEFKQEDEKINV